jgi:uncharacterized protein with FMN-binding domain
MCLAQTGERKAMRYLVKAHAKAVTATLALMALRDALSKAQSKTVDKIIAAELVTQAFLSVHHKK